MSNTLDYKFQVNQKVFYYHAASGSFKRATITQINIDAFTDGIIQNRVIFYNLRNADGSTVRLQEEMLFSDVGGTAPVLPQYNVPIKFQPGDSVWVADNDHKKIREATVCHIEVKIYSTYVVKLYWVNYQTSDCRKLETSVQEQETVLFDTADKALAYIGIIVVPTPTPYASFTPTVTPTRTITPTPTPTVTPTVTMTPAVTVTPTPSAPPASPPAPPVVLVVSKLNDTGQTLSKGMAVSINPATGNLVKSSSADTRALNFLGFVYDDFIPDMTWGRVVMEGSIVNTAINWNDAIAEGGALQTGRKYYLATNGEISIYPATVGYVKQLGFAVNSEILDIRIQPSVKL